MLCAEQMRALAREGKLCLGTVDAWLLFKLTGGKVHATDVTNASRTALLNLETMGWDDELLQIFGVPRGALPEVLASAQEFGTCSALPQLANVSVASVIGDSHAALAAHGGLAWASEGDLRHGVFVDDGGEPIAEA